MRDDEFICPVCGATVPAKARACPECGSDEKTGWSDQTIYDDTGIEDPEEFDYDEYVRREFGQGPKRSGRQWLWWVAGVIVIGLMVWFLVSGH